MITRSTQLPIHRPPVGLAPGRSRPRWARLCAGPLLASLAACSGGAHPGSPADGGLGSGGARTAAGGQAGQAATGGGGSPSGGGGRSGSAGASGAAGSGGLGGAIGTGGLGGAIGTGGLSGVAGSGGLGGATGTGGRTTTISSVSVVTNRYDNARSGANSKETVLTASNVVTTRFGLLFSRAVDGQVYAQPLYLGGLTLADGTVHDVVYVATQHNTVYAFDADDPAAAAPLWSRNLGPSGSAAGFSCTDMLIEVGITSTPVIDPASGTLFVVAKGQENGAWIQRLHALDVKTGAEKTGSPLVIAASAPGLAAGNVNGRVAFDPMTALNRPGLLFQDGVVYLAFASHCDSGAYHGWVLGYGYDGAKLTQTKVYNDSPNGAAGGIWQGGVGLSADASSLYFAAGNGTTNPTSTPLDLSESVVRLGIADFAVKDYWIPTAFNNLNATDSDLSTGAILLPHNLLLTGSKDGRLYVLDSTNLGQYSAVADQILQTLTTPGRASGQLGHLHGGPIYYSIAGTEWVYLWPEESQLIGYQLDPTTRKLQNLVQGNLLVPGHPGGIMTLSANGAVAGTGILWAAIPQMDAWHSTQPGTLYAVDASDITRSLWSSEQNAARDAVGNFAKFVPPVVANGRVYLATFSNKLQVYGLLN